MAGLVPDWHPKFMTLQELQDAGHCVNLGYNPIWSFSRYNVQETSKQFYDRCCQVTKEILKRHEVEGGSILFVAHDVNLDSCTRQSVSQRGARQASMRSFIRFRIVQCR